MDAIDLALRPQPGDRVLVHPSRVPWACGALSAVDLIEIAPNGTRVVEVTAPDKTGQYVTRTLRIGKNSEDIWHADTLGEIFRRVDAVIKQAKSQDLLSALVGFAGKEGSDECLTRAEQYAYDEVWEELMRRVTAV